MINIDWGEEPFFKLTPDERCPFLKDSGLCKIIEELGEEGLCDICRLHPRFFESVNDHNLAGVGLSCEKAAELLFEKEKLDELATGESLMRFRVIYQYIIFRQLELVREYGVPKIIEYAVRSIIFIMLYAGIFGDALEAVRRWSEQIEYNEDNLNQII